VILVLGLIFPLGRLRFGSVLSGAVRSVQAAAIWNLSMSKGPVLRPPLSADLEVIASTDPSGPLVLPVMSESPEALAAPRRSTPWSVGDGAGAAPGLRIEDPDGPVASPARRAASSDPRPPRELTGREPREGPR
jgi:hypothetical protein